MRDLSVDRFTNSPITSGGRMRLSSKYYLRRLLGDYKYRAITQTLRIANYILRPRYEPEVAALPLLVGSGDYCFDIGANYGHYSRLLSPLVGTSGHIYACEPSAITSAGLRMAKRLLRLRNVHIHQCALADVPGEMTLTIPIKEHGGLGIALAHLGPSLHREGITEVVRVRTLDEVMASHGIMRCDFIKCDVEGAELLVLRGGVGTIRQFKPTMLLEIDSSYLARHDHTLEEVQSFLRNEGYGFYGWDGAKLIAAAGLHNHSNNFVIHPDRLKKWSAHKS